MSTSSQIVIIGAGPGGYVAAFHAADLGMSVTLIDKETNPGGVCLYRGCIPSKALLHAARVLDEAESAKNFGVEFGAPKLDINRLREWKQNIVTRLTGGLGQLSKQRKINFINGEAKFLNSSTLEIKKNDGSTQQLSFEKAVLATGSRPIVLPFLPKTARVWDSTRALELPEIPETLLLIGGGYIGLELGTAYAAMGSKVTVVEAMPQLLTGADRDLADVLIKRLKTKFVKIMTDTQVKAAVETSSGMEVTFQDKEGKQTKETFAVVLTSVGRRPNTEGLGLETTKVKVTDKGFVEVDLQRRTTDQNIYAIGDIAGQPMLAHKASFEAKIAVEAAAGQKVAYEPKSIPAVVFTDPEVAWVGLTELEAKAQNREITIFKFPWAASGRAMTLDRTDGITKVISDSKTKRILGIGIVGVGAGDLISEGTLAIEMGAVAEDLAMTIHPHPTLSEMIMETAEGLFGQCTHIYRPKK